MASAEDVMRGQIVALNDALGQVQSTVAALQQRLEVAEEDASRANRRGGGRHREEGDEDADGDDDMRGKPKDLMSRKFFEPAPFNKSSGSFRDWAEEFVDFIAMRDENLAAALDNARDSKSPVLRLGDNDKEIAQAKRMYRIVKKLMEHPDAIPIIKHVPGKNVWEAWRTLHSKFDPQNDAAQTRTVVRLIDSKYWHCKTVDRVPIAVAQWEALAQEHERKTGETVLTAALKREIFLDILPQAMREQVEMATLLMRREDVTYDHLKNYVLAWVFRHAAAPKGHAQNDPMDVGALGTKEPVREWHEEPETWVDSLGGYGKTKGVGKGKEQQPPDKVDRICNCCGIKGHYARECGSWDKPSDVPGKTKGQVYEAKRAAFKGGKKGGGKAKGKGKKGKGKINSWETEESSWEDADWQDESAAPTGEEANKQDGEAYALDVGLGNGFEDEEFPLLGMTVEVLENEFEKF